MFTGDRVWVDSRRSWRSRCECRDWRMEEAEERGRMYGSRECATWGIGQVSAMVRRARCLYLQRSFSVICAFRRASNCFSGAPFGFVDRS